jgi:kynurenine formamidase
MKGAHVSVAAEDDLGKARLAQAARLYCNWGRWGENDQAGTLNFVTAEMVREAAASITRGQVFSLAIPFGQDGPQTGGLLRFNPMRFMLRDGDDTFSRALVGLPRSIGGADDVIMLATHGATHWDALAHVHYDSKMWNGYDCREVSSFGAERNDIAQYKDRIVGRAVLLDFPRYFGTPWCDIGQAITGDDIDACAERQGVQIRTGDILLLRFGHIAMCRDRGSWGSYAGGDAPGLAFDTLAWIHQREIAGVASDTWGVEVRPNEFTYANQPWHRVAIPQLGLLVGEIFDLEALAEDCAADGRYEVFFCANPLPVTGSVGGPINPIAIK